MERIDYVSLYQFDEIYLIEGEEQGQSVTIESQKEAPLAEAPVVEIPVAEIPKLVVSTDWLVLGEEADRPKIAQIFAAAPFSFSENQFTFLANNLDSISIDELLALENVQKIVLLGSRFESYGLKPEPDNRSGKMIYYFNRSLESLTDEERDLKRLFWNQLKKML